MGPKKNNETNNSPTKTDSVVSNETESENTIALQRLATQMATQFAQVMEAIATTNSSIAVLKTRMDDVEVTNKNDDEITINREDKKTINDDANAEPVNINSNLSFGFTRSNSNLTNPIAPKTKGIFISTKSTSASVAKLLEEATEYINKANELDANQPRKLLLMIKQASQMTNTQEHLEGSTEYIPDNGSTLPLTTKTIIQANAKKVYISPEEVGKLQSISSELCTLMTTSMVDDTLRSIADGFNTDGNGPLDNMQPYLMFHNLFKKFGIGDTTSKVESIDEIAMIKQEDMPDLAYFSKFNIIYKRQIQLNQPLQFDVILHYMLKNSSYQDTYEFIQSFIQNGPDKSPKKFMELALDRDSKAITNEDRKRRHTNEIEGNPVYGIKSRPIQSSSPITSSVNGIRSDNYLQVGQVFKPGGCTNCLSTNHTLLFCTRPCISCFQLDPSKATHAARDCPRIQSSTSKPEVKVSKVTPTFGSREHEAQVRKQIKNQLVQQILAGEEISASSSDSEGAHRVNYIGARNWNGALSEEEI